MDKKGSPKRGTIDVAPLERAKTSPGGLRTPYKRGTIDLSVQDEIAQVSKRGQLTLPHLRVQFEGIILGTKGWAETDIGSSGISSISAPKLTRSPTISQMFKGLTSGKALAQTENQPENSIYKRPDMSEFVVLPEHKKEEERIKKVFKKKNVMRLDIIGEKLLMYVDNRKVLLRDYLENLLLITNQRLIHIERGRIKMQIDWQDIVMVKRLDKNTFSYNHLQFHTIDNTKEDLSVWANAVTTFIVAFTGKIAKYNRLRIVQALQVKKGVTFPGMPGYTASSTSSTSSSSTSSSSYSSKPGSPTSSPPGSRRGSDDGSHPPLSPTSSLSSFQYGDEADILEEHPVYDDREFKEILFSNPPEGLDELKDFPIIHADDLYPSPHQAEDIQQEGTLLGQGMFGIVYRAKWKSRGKFVAVKNIPQQKVKEFIKEAAVLQLIRKAMRGKTGINIVEFYGICVQQEDKKMKSLSVILELAKESVSNWLSQCPPEEWRRRVEILLDIAQGMLFLHENGVLHRDLKGLNVLLTERGKAVLTDFGTAKERQKIGDQTAVQGTYAWGAPEVLTGIKVSYPADVYAFSMVMYEMMVKEIPWYYQGEPSLASMIHKVIFYAERPMIPNEEKCPDMAYIPDGYLELMKACWDQDQTKRPNFEVVVKALKKILKRWEDEDEMLSGGSQDRKQRARKILESLKKEEKARKAFNMANLLLNSVRELQAKTEDSKIKDKDDFSETDSGMAFELFTIAAEEGLAEAQFRVAGYYAGFGTIAKDEKKSFEWFKRAADQGYAEAEYAVAHLYEKGIGVSQDYKQASNYYARVALKYHLEAQVCLSRIFREGKGIPNVLTQAIEERGLTIKATAAELVRLGYAYQEGRREPLNFKDYATAKSFYELAISAGKTDAEAAGQAHYLLGKLYEAGKVHSKVKDKHLEHYKKAQELGFKFKEK